MKFFIFLIIAVVLFSSSLFAQSTITYQGKLLDNNGLPVNLNNVAMSFAIYDGPSSSTKLWPASNPSASKTVNVEAGIYSVILGTGSGNDEVFVSSAFSGTNPYLEVTINATTLPRVPISAVPVSLLSNGLSASAWASPGNIGSTTPGSAAFTSMTLNTGSNSFSFPSGRGQSGEVLTSGGDGTTSWSSASGGSGIPVPAGSETNDLLSFDGTNWVAKALVINNTGSGTSISNMQPYLVLNYCIALEGIYPARDATDPYVGEITIYPYNFNPRSTAFCHGQVLSIAQNTALFSLLGTNFGGNGTTTFGLPDLRGRTPIGAGQGSGLSTRTLGENGGAETFTISVGNLPSHSHTITYQ